MGKALHIRLKNGTAAEEQMRQLVNRLTDKYELDPWCFTDTISIDEAGWPHSHPVLTLNTEYADDETMALSELVHEQLHWFEEMHQESRDRAIEETKRHYPTVPAGRPEGAGDETSTRLHLLVCYLEYQAMKLLAGEAEARKTITALTAHHYRWVYRTVLDDERRLGDIVERHGLVPVPLLGGGSAS